MIPCLNASLIDETPTPLSQNLSGDINIIPIKYFPALSLHKPLPENNNSILLMAKENVFDFETLFRVSYNSLCYFSRQYISDDAVAEDLVQDAFLQLYKVKADFFDMKSAKSYLYTCVRNAALNIIRRQKVEEKFMGQNAIEQNEDRVMNDIILSEVIGAVNNAIEMLPEKCRNIFKLGYFDELKNPEIAAQLGISINTVKTQKQRALQMLRFKLKDFDMLPVFLFSMLQVVNIFF